MDWHGLSLDEIFQESCFESFPDSEIVTAMPGRTVGSSHMTFRQVRLDALKLADALRRRGIGRDSRVILMLPNWIESIVTFQACVALGATIIPMIHVYGWNELCYVIANSSPNAIFLPSEWQGRPFGELIRQVGDAPNGPRLVVSIGDDAPEGSLSYGDLLRDSNKGPIHLSREASPDVHVMAFTSGSTADPKGVLHTETTMKATVGAITIGFDATPEDVIFNPNPVGHAAGMLCSYYVPFVVGTRRVIMFDSWDPKLAVNACEQFGATIMGGAALFLDTMLRAAGPDGIERLSLRACALGAAGVPPALIREADRRGITCVRTYGLTEQATVTMGRLNDGLEVRAESDGREMAGSTVIVHREDEGAGADHEGEIWIKGNGQCTAYLEGSNAVDPRNALGWLETGDLGTMDRNGYLTVTGRVKDIIITGGRNVSAPEVEEVVRTHPGIADCAVAGLPSPIAGEQLCAFVRAKKGNTITLADLRSHFRDKGVPAFKIPKRLVIVDELPTTLAGKVQKHKLVEQVLAGE